MKFRRAHHTSYVVSDLEKSVDFYGRVLGLEPLARPDFKFPGAWFAIGPYQIHLIAAPHDQANERQVNSLPQPRAVHLALEVEDVEPVKQRLAQEGIPFIPGEALLSHMQQVFCRDPDGHQLEFIAFKDN